MKMNMKDEWASWVDETKNEAKAVLCSQFFN